MKLLESAQMHALDRYAIDKLGVPSTLLMTHAAQHVASAALELLYSSDHDPAEYSAAIFCGPGNNGGDGVAAASILLKHGIQVRTFLTGSREKMTPDTREMEQRYNELGGTLEDLDTAANAENFTNNCSVIIDAIFGIGLNAELRGCALDAVRLINTSKASVVSADIPSGVEADTGRILGDCVHADVTVTFTFSKPGLTVEPGCTACGEVLIADIGIPAEALKNADTANFAVTREDVLLPRRKKATHKGDYGRVLIIAGSVGFSGAPVLSARAASKTGAGLVSLGVPNAIYAIVAGKCDEEMVFPLPATAEGSLGGLAVYSILDKLKKSDVCLIGPGLGRSASIDEIVSTLLRTSDIPVILDADGINAVSRNIDILDEARCPVILTPHDGEFARLVGESSADSAWRSTGDRLNAARSFAETHRCTLVLKGHRTITALPDGTVYVNTTGGPAMAKGGTGDVLAGMIASFTGQKFTVKDAVLTAVYLHGFSGDMCAAAYGEYSVTASDITSMLPEAIKSIIL